MAWWVLRRRLRRVAVLWGPLTGISILSVVAALLAWSHITRTESPHERLNRAAGAGQIASAETLSWEILQKQPRDIETWIRFIDMHAILSRVDADEDSDEDSDLSRPAVSDSAIRKLLAQTGDVRVTTVASYWYERRSGRKPDPAAVTALADAQPPARFANHVLGRTALDRRDWRTSARRFEREGFAFPDHERRSLRRSLAIWINHNAWDEVRRRAHDARYATALDAGVRLDLATHDRDWPRILLWIWPASFVNVQAWPIALAILAAVLWMIIATRLGRIQDAVPGRALLYALSFALGIISIYPTLITITIEESIFGLQRLEQFVPDAIYFIFGVGLREEGWKLLMFLPLLPALLRRGSRIEAMTCGALVGLGFAAEENIGYFHEFGAAAALSRFLTANFLHMSLTALVALSVYDTRRGRATSRDGFDVVFPLAVAIHGAYDFFLSTNEMPMSSIFSMVLFVIISQRFLRQLLVASSKAEEQGALYLLIASLALITGVSYVYATTLAGPLGALRLMSVGVLGVAIVIYMFVRELGSA